MRDTWGDHADISVRTDNTEAREALWALANEAEAHGDGSFKLTEDMRKSALHDAHQIWIIVNDAGMTALLLAKIYRTLKPFAKKGGAGISIKFDGALKISRDESDRLKEIGCEITFVSESAKPYDETKLVE